MCNPAFTQIDKDIRQATIWRRIKEKKKRRQISEKQKNESRFLYHDKIVKKNVGDIFMGVKGRSYLLSHAKFENFFIIFISNICIFFFKYYGQFHWLIKVV